MKFITAIILVALLGFASGFYLPWWSIALAAFIGSGVVQQGHGRSFLAGFIGIFMLWGSLAWWIDTDNNSILSHKIAQVLPLGGSGFALILLTAFIGALVGGFAALSGSYVRKLFRAN